MFQNIFDWLTRNLGPTVIPVTIVLGLIWGAMTLAASGGETRANEWLRVLKLADDVPNASFVEKSKLPFALRERLAEQLEESKNRERYHAEVMKFFYSRYYMAIIMFAGLGALSAIMLFFISKKGWAAADDRLIAVFIVASAAAVCFGAMPAVFRQEDNIAENKSLLLQYSGLQDQVLTFLAIAAVEEPPPVDPSKDQSKAKEISDAKTFIAGVDKQLKELNSLAVGFDASKIPTKFIPELSDNKTDSGAKKPPQ